MWSKADGVDLPTDCLIFGHGPNASRKGVHRRCVPCVLINLTPLSWLELLPDANLYRYQAQFYKCVMILHANLSVIRAGCENASEFRVCPRNLLPMSALYVTRYPQKDATCQTGPSCPAMFADNVCCPGSGPTSKILMIRSDEQVARRLP